MANPGSWSKGFKSFPSIEGGKILSKGLEVKKIKQLIKKQSKA